MRTIWFPLLLALILAGCVGGDAGAPASSAADPGTAPKSATSRPVRLGPQTFMIVPEQSKASYLADEEFFAGALKKLGIKAGRIRVVGSTQAIEGRFELDPRRPTAGLFDNTFTVRMNTFTTDQSRRDRYIREDGPRFDDYPRATFKATAVEAAVGAAGGELRVKLTGDLMIRAITKRASFDVKAQLVDNTLTGVATTRLLMSDFGIEPLDFYNTLTVADEIGLEIRFTAMAQ